jgi:hypothetical protein
MFKTSTRSSTHLVIGPTVSNKEFTGKTPCREVRPTVGLIVYNAARIAGLVSEPAVSVPIDMGAKPALTPTADPEDEPPGFSSVGQLCFTKSPEVLLTQ